MDIYKLFSQKKLVMPIYNIDNTGIRHCLLLPSCKDNAELWSRMAGSDSLFILQNIFDIKHLIYKRFMNDKEIIFDLDFFGVSQLPNNGFTVLKDYLVDFYSEDMKYNYDLKDYVMFDVEVHSMTHGVVKRINNDYIDWISKIKPSTINENEYSDDNLYGNSITIDYEGCEITYYGLKRHSMNKFKLGDIVVPRQLIGRVGCNGKLGSIPFLHVSFKVPGNKEIIDLSKINFEPFYNVPIINSYRNTPEAISRMSNREVNYVYNSGNIIYSDGLLVKKI